MSNWMLIILTASLGLLTPNPALTFTSILSLPYFVMLLWRKGEPPVLLFALIYQWFQVCTKIFHANILGVSIESMFGAPAIIRATWLSLAGLVILAIGMRLGIGQLKSINAKALIDGAHGFSLSRLWAGYLIAFVFSLIFSRVAWSLSQLTQILLPLLNFKWVMFFLLAYTILSRRQKKIYLILAIVIEMVKGFSGFFADYKQVFFVLVVAMLTVGYRFSPKNVSKLILIAILVIFLGTVWTSVKSKYRDFLNAGTGQQIVTVSLKERASKLFELFSTLDASSLSDGFKQLAERLAYTDMFAYVLEMVPRHIPHEGGLLWKKAVIHVLVPRLFYPNKPDLGSDSELTMKYTGLKLASEEQGTVISLGYMVESYIDFGPWLMYGPIFIVGLLWGLMYQYFLSHSKTKILGCALAVSVLINANQFEIYCVKLVGGILMSFIVTALVQRFLSPPLTKWLIKG